MRIIGIDPGYAIVGFGILEYSGIDFKVVEYGAITTSPDMDFYERLKTIYNDLSFVLKRYGPHSMAIEKLYFNTNQKTGIDVAQARGVIMLSAALNDISVFEYTPLQVKQAVVGYGRAKKEQVQQMVKVLLNLDKIPKPDDAADALAVAICHAHSNNAINLYNIK